jgi:large subunit ribosomal protein L5
MANKNLRLKQRYAEEVVPALMKEFGYDNKMRVPRVLKMVVNIGVGEALDNPKALEFAVADMRAITGQNPVVTKARKSIATFKLREGRSIGVKVDLRGDRCGQCSTVFKWRCPACVTSGGQPGCVRGRGNYTLGMREQLISRKSVYKIDNVRGMGSRS